MHALADIPPNSFGAILSDPPWTYSVFSDKGKGRSAEQHYNTMSLADICALPVAPLAKRDCHLFMWVTGPCLVKGMHLPVMEAWGFKPSSDVFVWLKAKRVDFENGCFFLDETVFAKGMGHTSRKNAEYVVLGRRGAPRRLSKAIHQIIVAPKREHSRKPDEIYDRIEAYCAGPYLEMFARQSRPGWTSWGNETRKFDEVAA